MMFIIRADGLTETMDRIKRLAPRIEATCSHTVKTAGEEVMSVAKSFAPRDTGALIRAIHYESSKIRGGWHSTVIADIPNKKNWSGDTVPYQAFIETGNVMPRWGMVKGTRERLHFMSQAYEFAKRTFPNSLINRVEAVIAHE